MSDPGGSGAPNVRPGFLIAGGVLIAAAVLYAVFAFVLGGDPAPEDVPTTVAGDAQSPSPEATEQAPSSGEGGNDTGRDPFGGGTVDLSSPAPERTSTPTGVRVEVVAVFEDSSGADIRIGDERFARARVGDRLPAGITVVEIAEGCVIFGQGADRFSVCAGAHVVR